MTQYALVVDNQKNPLMPCHPARARELLDKGKAAVLCRHPFTIILKHRVGGDKQDVELKIDPGSKTTGVALVVHGQHKKRVIWVANLHHRGEKIRDALTKRRNVRHSRRHRKTRYRAARFNNRTRKDGWLPPSLQSRVDNVSSLTKRLTNKCPISHIAVETVRFDMQKMQNPEISGCEYQQGTLQGYEVREYLLEKWKRACAYCAKKDVPLQIEHIVPKSHGGSNRIANLALACHECNQSKGNQPIECFLADKPHKLNSILKQCKAPLKDASAVNSTRYAIGNSLKAFNLPISFWSGGRTKHNRVKQNLPKEHWIDAACVGETGDNLYIPKGLTCLRIKACGRGNRQMCRVNRHGFVRTTSKGARQIKGFKTGDIVKAVITKGKKAGTYIGRVAVRSSGSFNISQGGTVIQGINARFCHLLHRADGYNYTIGGGVSSSR